MQHEKFIEFAEKFFKQLKQQMTVKGHDYRSGSSDHFANFKRNADRLGLTSQQVWAVYANKHHDAVMTYIREGDVQSEPIVGRIGDLISYLFILAAYAEEKAEEREDETK